MEKQRMKYDYEVSPQGIKSEEGVKDLSHVFLFDYLSKLLKKKNQVKILEIGCGGGRNLLAIKQRFGNKVNLLGSDISQTALNYARSLKIGKFRKTDSEKIPFKEKHDLILMIDLLEHLESEESVKKTLSNAQKSLNQKGRLYLSMPVELNRFSLTWLFSKFPYLKDLTRVFHGHTLQFKIDDFLNLIDKKSLKVEKVFYSVHYISQIQSFFFYFIPKSLLRLVLGEKVAKDLRDSNEIIKGRNHSLLSLVKKVFTRLGRSLSWLAFKESSLRKNSSFGSEKIHLLLKRR